MNDIFVLYKQADKDKEVDAFRKTLSARFPNCIIRDYDDSLPEESYYESTRSLVLLCLIDDEWFYDPQCRSIWKYFWDKQNQNCASQILFPAFIEKVNIGNFDDRKKIIYGDASTKLGAYNLYDLLIDTKDEQETAVEEAKEIKLKYVDEQDLISDILASLELLAKDGVNGQQNFRFASKDEQRNTHNVYKIGLRPNYHRYPVEEQTFLGAIKKWLQNTANLSYESRLKHIRTIIDELNRNGDVNNEKEREKMSELECELKGNLNAINTRIIKIWIKNHEGKDIEKELIGERLYPKDTAICVLYTGGTAGMIFDPFEDESLELKQADLEQLIIKLPRLKREKYEIDFYSFDPALDSSNIGSEHWLLIAAVIKILAKEYKGFVIIHGTNTMAYTASALSFLFEKTADKPIILTGSELALTERNSDAEDNIHRSIEIAAQKDTNDVQGVCILFGKWLLRGNRATKQIALDKADGFYSPNYPELASVSSDKIIVDLAHSQKSGATESFKMDFFISSIPKVIICDIYPDMDMNAFYNNCTSNDVEAVILRTYGTGGVPDKSDRFIECLKLLQNKKIVVNLTQCPKGTSEFRLFETNETLFNYGVISGGDMVTEAAYCKLKHLFAKFSSVKNNEERIRYIKHYMMVNMQGEMSRSMFIIPIDIDDNNVEINNQNDGTVFELNADWANNPALGCRDLRKITVTNDKFASLSTKDFIASAVLRFGGVQLIRETGKKDDPHLRFSIAIVKSGKSPAFNESDSITQSVKYSTGSDNKQDIGIDILQIAKNLLTVNEALSIYVKLKERTIRVDSVNLLLSVTQR